MSKGLATSDPRKGPQGGQRAKDDEDSKKRMSDDRRLTEDLLSAEASAEAAQEASEE